MDIKPLLFVEKFAINKKLNVKYYPGWEWRYGGAMYLKEHRSGDLVEILDISALFDPCAATVSGRFHAGEELQDPQDFAKADLIFPSDETLPICWTAPHYKHKP